MNWVLAPYRDPQTYRTAAYLVTGLVMGVFDFVVIITGLSLGFGLAVTVIGIPILIATFLVARSLATFERHLARNVLAAPLPRRRLISEPEGRGYLARLRGLVTSRRSWSEIAFLLLRLPMGILDFTVVVTVFALAFGGFVYPWLIVAGIDSSVGGWVIDTLPESLFYVPVSVLFFIVGGRLIQAWGEVSRRFATLFLGTVGRDEIKREVADLIARSGPVDAYQILRDVEFRLGDGPFLDATRVQAALVSLEEMGYISASAEGSLMVYRAA